tara:strand:- start:190 stop:546 length:357 start_codon:yes stop_codon:yes gene_type:complete
MKTIEFKDVSFVIGENAEENWNLLEKYTLINKNYIWFHLNSFPSCYVFMLTDKIDITGNTNNTNNIDIINYGAYLCKKNTKYRNLKNIKICYTKLYNIGKTKIVGEVEIIGKKKIIKL